MRSGVRLIEHYSSTAAHMARVHGEHMMKTLLFVWHPLNAGFNDYIFPPSRWSWRPDNSDAENSLRCSYNEWMIGDCYKIRSWLYIDGAIERQYDAGDIIG